MVDVKAEKRFNKAMLDLMQMSSYEWYAGQARIEDDYGLWVSSLEAWLNKLSPDMEGSDIDRLDTELHNARELLNDRTQRGQVRDMLNKIERELYKNNKRLGISNPDKENLLSSEESWDVEE